MNTANHISPEDLALFALQCLPEDELAAAVEHMEHCEACRNEVGNLQGDLVAYAMTAEMHTPPAAARERLLRRVAKEKKLVPMAVTQAAPVDPALTARSSSLLFTADNVEEMPVRRGMGVGGWLGWAIAAGALVAGGLQFHQRQVLQGTVSSLNARLTQADADSAKAQLALDAITGAFQVALHDPKSQPAPGKKLPEGHTAYDAEKGALVFMATNLAPLPAYKTYELWVIPPGGDKAVPIPAGTFKPDANNSASVLLPDIPRGVTAQAFGVTIEDEGGSKTPTMSTLTLLGE